jgi:hypothetical protein
MSTISRAQAEQDGGGYKPLPISNNLVIRGPLGSTGSKPDGIYAGNFDVHRAAVGVGVPRQPFGHSARQLNRGGVQLWRNFEARRKVISQIIDYARDIQRLKYAEL